MHITSSCSYFSWLNPYIIFTMFLLLFLFLFILFITFFFSSSYSSLLSFPSSFPSSFPFPFFILIHFFIDNVLIFWYNFFRQFYFTIILIIFLICLIQTRIFFTLFLWLTHILLFLFKLSILVIVLFYMNFFSRRRRFVI